MMKSATTLDDPALRPTDFSGYIGQDAVKEVLDVAIEAAQERGDTTLEHILIWGPPGYGKTTLANIIANAMGQKLLILIGGNMRSAYDVTKSFKSMEFEDQHFMFIDEIHRMWITAEEMLYPPMEDRILNRKIGSRMMVQELEPFTLIGATTEPEKLAQPFKDRFGIKLELMPYTVGEMATIVLNSAERLGLDLTEKAAVVIGHRSGGTPRVANMMVRRLRDFAQYHDVKVLDEDFVSQILEKKGLRWTA